MQDKRALLDVVLTLASIARAALERRQGPSEAGAPDTTSDNPGEQVDTVATGVDHTAMSTVRVAGMDASEFLSRRKTAGMTQAEAARRLGVTTRTVIRWEHGACKIDPFKAEVACRELVRRKDGLSPAEREIAKFGRRMAALEDELSGDTRGRAVTPCPEVSGPSGLFGPEK